jgi:hypothetical protein
MTGYCGMQSYRRLKVAVNRTKMPVYFIKPNHFYRLLQSKQPVLDLVGSSISLSISFLLFGGIRIFKDGNEWLYCTKRNIIKSNGNEIGKIEIIK